MKRHKKTEYTNIFLIVAFLVLGGLSISESRAAEEKYPNKLINIVLPISPGATDMALRPFTDKLPDYLGQPMTIVYKPGAGGVIGSSFVAKAKPDGYTLLCFSHVAVILVPITRETDFTSDDFIPICRLVRSPFMLVVKADSPWKTLKDIVGEAKKSPDTLNYSIVGVLGPTDTAMEMFKKSAGIKMIKVPTTGSGEGIAKLLGGHVNMTNSSMAPAVPHVKSGALRPIAVFEKKRLKEFPNVPTLAELGYPVVAGQWYALFAPKGTPGRVVKTIYTAVEKVVKDHKNFLEDRLGKLSLTLDYANPEEFGKEFRAENEATKVLVKEMMKTVKME